MSRRARTIVTCLVAAATLAVVGVATWLSLDPANFFFYRPEDRARWVFNPLGLALICALMVGEAALTRAALLADRGPLWPHGLIGLAILGPWAALCTLSVMHMPRYVHLHVAWVCLLVVVLAAATVVSGVRAALRPLRR